MAPAPSSAGSQATSLQLLRAFCGACRGWLQHARSHSMYQSSLPDLDSMSNLLVSCLLPPICMHDIIAADTESNCPLQMQCRLSSEARWRLIRLRPPRRRPALRATRMTEDGGFCSRPKALLQASNS